MAFSRQFILRLVTLGVLAMVGTSCATPSPTEIVSTTVTVEATTTTSFFSDDVQEPSVPGGGGSGLPLEPGSGESVDCGNAEELCDSGEWACDDIADYCDIGPDGGELPEDWDWDR